MRNEKQKPIVLVGMMGAGKTHIGRILAENLGLNFYDSDQLIEERAGLSIPEIFERYGEEKFRMSEHKTISETLERGPMVLSTGGGALLNPETVTLLQDRTHIVWINAPIELMWSRVKDGGHRPLLQTENPRQTLEELLEARKPLYEQAHIKVINDDRPTKQIVLDIINLLSEEINLDTV